MHGEDWPPQTIEMRSSGGWFSRFVGDGVLMSFIPQSIRGDGLGSQPITRFPLSLAMIGVEDAYLVANGIQLCLRGLHPHGILCGVRWR